MIDGVKVYGSDTEPNFILIDSKFHLISPDLCSFVIIKTDDSIPNIDYIGYSVIFKRLFIQMRNNGRYFYEDVPAEKWHNRHNYEKINAYWAAELRGHFSYFQSNETFIRMVSNEYVLDAYLKLEQFKFTKSGLWATDVPEKVSDPENVLFQI